MFYLYKEAISLDKKKVTSAVLLEVLASYKASDAFEICLYIYLVASRDEDNPIKDLEVTDRLSYAKSLAFKKLKPTEADMDLFKSKYQAYAKENTDKLQRDIDLYDSKLNQFRQLLLDTKPEIVKNTHEVTDNVTYTSNIGIITEILANVIKITIEKGITQGMKKSGKFVQSLRGGLSPNMKGKTAKLKD